MPDRNQSVRLVQEATTDPAWSCWTLFAGDSVLGSVSTPSDFTLAQAQEAFREKKASDARILDAIDRIVEHG